MIELNSHQIDYIKKVISTCDFTIKNSFINKIKDEYNIGHIENTEKIDIESLGEIMYFHFSKDKSREHGITYTPIKTVKVLFDELLGDKFEYYSNKKVLDPSIGVGSFFIGFLIKQKEKNPSFSIIHFIENNLHGYDIKKENIFFCKLNLILLALYYGEDAEQVSFNIYQKDTVRLFIDNEISKNFDLIIGNPPYVKQQNLDLKTRNILTNNFKTIYSNYNLYYAFIELSVNILKPGGRIVYLVPNYLLKIKSAERLRKFLIQQNYFESIIDFETNKLFPGIDTYTMAVTLKQNSSSTSFKVIKDPKIDIKSISWDTKKITMSDYNSIDLINQKDSDLIYSVINQPNSLIISTGIATLKDKLYLIDYIDEEGNFIKIYNNKHYKIESDLIKNIIKGSGQSKKGIIKQQYIIYPYFLNSSEKAMLVPYEVMINKYPSAANYFIDTKEELLKRSGSYQDNNWYQYGRSQSLNRFNPKIIFPTNTDKPKFKYFPDSALFYNGYAILGLENHTNNTKLFQVLCLILNSDIIDKFMKLTSYYIGGGYVSYQKKYLERVKIPNLTILDINKLLSLKNSKDELNEYIAYLYQR